MKILIIHKDKGLRAAAIRKLSKVPMLSVAKGADANGDWYDHEIMFALEEYDLIVLPLTLPHYGSLRFAELAHLTNAPCRLILLSATRTPVEVLAKLFDAVVDSLDVADITVSSKKVRTLSQIHSAIEAILENADCFHWVDSNSYDAKRQVGSHTNPDRYLHVPDLQAYQRVRQYYEERPKYSSEFVFFSSYAHTDETLHQQFMKHTVPILGPRTVVWHDRMIGVGTNWAKEINNWIDKCDAFLAFVSADFLASDYCCGIELSRALERNKNGDLRIIPVVLRPCCWQKTPLGTFKGLPIDGKPVTSWSNQDEAFAIIADELLDVYAELVGQEVERSIG